METNKERIATGVDPATMRKVMRRLLPLMMILMIVNQIDRSNIGFAALTMNKDLGLTPYMFGLAAGMFSLGYILFEVPSNMILTKVGVNRWIARIMLTWGLVTIGMAFVVGPNSLYAARFLLGLAEAGFQPGMTFYVLSWIPLAERARFTGIWFIAVPLSPIIGGPLAGLLLQMNGVLGLAGWQWIFIMEGIPALLLSVVTWRYLTPRPAAAEWLEPAERDALERTIESENAGVHGGRHPTFRETMLNKRVLVLGLLYIGMNMGMYAANVWMPTIVKSLGSLGNLETTLVISLIWAVASATSIFWGRRSDRVQERYRHLGFALLFGAAGFSLSAYVGSPALAMACLTAAVAGILSGYVVFWVIPGTFLTGTAAAAGIALMNSMGNLGGFLGPFAVGWLRDSTGSFQIALQVLAGAMVVSGLIAIAIRPGRQTARSMPLPAATE